MAGLPRQQVGAAHRLGHLGPGRIQYNMKGPFYDMSSDLGVRCPPVPQQPPGDAVHHTVRRPAGGSVHTSISDFFSATW